jgi:ankyrin repeat protein
MSRSLPARPSLEWLRKTAKEELKQLRAANATAVLADAQRTLAREYGFESWRKLRQHVEQQASGAPPASPVAADDTPLTRDQRVQAFLNLVGTGRIDDVRRVLAAAPQMVNAVGPHPFWGGRPQALHVAIESKRRDLFDLLLESGADVNGSNDEYDHWSPLMLATEEGRGDMRDDLIQRGATVGLLEALLLGDDASAEKWLRPGASALPAFAPNVGSILNFARTAWAIDRLIELGAPTDIKDRWGSTPIESLSRRGAAGQLLVRHMVARGIPAAPEEYARLGDQTTLAALIENDRTSAVSDMVMMGAVDFGHHALVRWLLAHGGNVNARANARARQTALHSAAWNGDLPMATLLVEAGADLRARDGEHQGTPLDWARVGAGVTNNPRCLEVAAYLESAPE